MPEHGQLVQKLAKVLEEERNLLLQGQLDKLPEFLEQKRNLVEQLGDRIEAAELGPIADQIRRNHTLLNSAMEGIRRVSTRLDSLKKLRQSLETYDHTGQKTSISIAETGQVEKRA